MWAMGTLQSAGESSIVLTSSTSTPSRITGRLILFSLVHSAPGPWFRYRQSDGNSCRCAYSDGETFVSADDLRINLWHLEVTSQCFNIVDLKPADMGDLVGDSVIFSCHPKY